MPPRAHSTATAAIILVLPAAGRAQGQPSSSRRSRGQTRAPRSGPARRGKVTEIASGFDKPWAIAFLPDRRMLVTEKPTEGSTSSPPTGRSPRRSPACREWTAVTRAVCSTWSSAPTSARAASSTGRITSRARAATGSRCARAPRGRGRARGSRACGSSSGCSPRSSPRCTRVGASSSRRTGRCS